MAKEMKKASTKKVNETANNNVEVVETEKPEVKDISKKNEDAVVSPEKLEIDELKKQIAMLQSLVLANNKQESSFQDDGYIRADRNIQVMSLTPHILNLSTGGNGKGKIFKFTDFGDVKNIIYSDLSDVLLNYNELAEKGAFYIFDKDVVKRHGLESAYEKILDKKGIDSFLEKDYDEIKSIFENLSYNQQSAIVDSIINKIINDEDISTGKVNLIKELYGQDIYAMADEMKNWEDQVSEIEESGK